MAKKSTNHCDEPNYDSELESIAASAKEVVHELRLLRKSVQHIEKIFEHSPAQIGKAIFRADPPTSKTER